MILTKVQSRIRCSLMNAYSYVRNMENQVFYNSSIKYVSSIESNVKYKMKIDLGLLTLEETYEILEEEENKVIVARCQSGSLDFTDRYEFEPHPEGMLLKISDEMNLKGIFKWSEAIVRINLQTQMGNNLKRLVHLLENQP